jgi:hypothetical protein
MAAFQVMWAQARWSRARWFWGLFDQRIRSVAARLYSWRSPPR